MKKFFITFLTIVSLVIGINRVSNAEQVLSEPDTYKVTVHTFQLCESGSSATSCSNPLTIHSDINGLEMDIAAVDAGAVAGSFGNLSVVQIGKTYTYGQVTLSRFFKMKATITTSSDVCTTNSAQSVYGIGHNNDADAVADATDGGTASEMWLPLPGNTYSGGSIYDTSGNSTSEYDGSGTHQDAGYYDGDDLYMQFRWELSKPFTPVAGKIAGMKIEFDVSNGIEFSNGDGDCDANSLFPYKPVITNTFE